MAAIACPTCGYAARWVGPQYPLPNYCDYCAQYVRPGPTTPHPPLPQASGGGTVGSILRSLLGSNDDNEDDEEEESARSPIPRRKKHPAASDEVEEEDELPLMAYILARYLYKEDLQQVLDELELPRGGAKSDLIERILESDDFTSDMAFQYIDKQELVELCEDLEIKSSGTRDDILKRLQSAIEKDEADREQEQKKQQVTPRTGPAAAPASAPTIAPVTQSGAVPPQYASVYHTTNIYNVQGDLAGTKSQSNVDLHGAVVNRSTFGPEPGQPTQPSACSQCGGGLQPGWIACPRCRNPIQL